MSNLYMIRHGQASFSISNYDRLFSLGRIQSEILGDYLLHLGISFDSAYAGDLERQSHTAKIVLGRMEDFVLSDLLIDPQLNEYDAQSVMQSQLPGLIKEKPSLARDLKRLNERRPFQRVFEGTILRWISGDHDTERVETWKAFSARVREAIKKIMHKNGRGKTVAIFTSGGPICAAVQMAIGVTDETTIRLNWQLPNTSVSALKYNNESLLLSSFNSIHHLQDRRDPKLVSYR